MRYVIAMLFAAGCAALTTIFLSTKLAALVVSMQTFESPDEVSTLFDLVFIGSSAVGLLIGWGIGWLVGGKILGETPA